MKPGFQKFLVEFKIIYFILQVSFLKTRLNPQGAF